MYLHLQHRFTSPKSRKSGGGRGGVVVPSTLCRCETQSINNRLTNKGTLEVFEMSCHKKKFGMKWVDKMTNTGLENERKEKFVQSYEKKPDGLWSHWLRHPGLLFLVMKV